MTKKRKQFQEKFTQLNSLPYFYPRQVPDVSTTEELSVIKDSVGISNGEAFSADYTAFFYCDTKLKTVERYDYDLEEGTISE